MLVRTYKIRKERLIFDIEAICTSFGSGVPERILERKDLPIHAIGSRG